MGMPGRLVAVGRHVAAAHVDGQLHDERALLVERRDDVVRVEDLQAVDELDVARVDGARAFLLDADGVRLRAGRP